jgi:hypothetical protein
VKIESVSLLCEGRCSCWDSFPTHTPHSPHKRRILPGDNAVAVMYACDECGHKRQWGLEVIGQ